MCGRFALFLTDSELAACFGLRASDLPPFGPRWNIAPGQTACIVTQGTPGTPRAFMAIWGLRPEWARGRRDLIAPINARVETASSRPMFRSALQSGRCVVPASGFYEWSGPKGRRVPHFFSAAQGNLLRFAGLFAPSESGEGTFAILTRPAAGPVAAVHDRMPVLLGEKEWDEWLAGDTFQVADFARLEPPLLRRTEASVNVNSVANEGPDLLLPHAEGESLF